MTASIELLPLPVRNYVDGNGLWETATGPYSAEETQDYARAVAEHNIAPLQAEVEALRAEVAEWKRVASAQAGLHDEAEARAKRLEKMLSAYQTAVNKIDDLIEYSLPMPPETKATLYAILANLTATLAQGNRND